MKIKHICSFLALCCAMNQDLSATISKVQEAFENNIEKHLKGHENDILRKCSYLNQINNTNNVIKICIENDYVDAINEIIKKVKEKSNSNNSFSESFSNLPLPYQVATIYDFRLTTTLMIENKDEKRWIDLLKVSYIGDSVVSDMTDFVRSLTDSKAAKVVEAYYWDDTAVANLREFYNKLKLQGDANVVTEALTLLDKTSFNDVYGQYRKSKSTGEFNSYVNNRSDKIVVDCDGNGEFDVLSSNVSVNNISVKKFSDRFNADFGIVIDSARAGYAKYQTLQEKDIKEYLFGGNGDFATANANLNILKNVKKVCDTTIDLINAENVLALENFKYPIEISGDAEGKKIEISTSSDVNEFNYLNVIDAIKNIALENFKYPIEISGDTEGEKIKISTSSDVNESNYLKVIDAVINIGDIDGVYKEVTCVQEKLDALNKIIEIKNKALGWKIQCEILPQYIEIYNDLCTAVSDLKSMNITTLIYCGCVVELSVIEETLQYISDLFENASTTGQMDLEYLLYTGNIIKQYLPIVISNRNFVWQLANNKIIESTLYEILTLTTKLEENGEYSENVINDLDDKEKLAEILANIEREYGEINVDVGKINKGFEDILQRSYNETELDENNKNRVIVSEQQYDENNKNRVLVSEQQYEDVTNAFNSLKDKVENAKSLIKTRLDKIQNL